MSEDAAIGAAGPGGSRRAALWNAIPLDRIPACHPRRQSALLSPF